MKKIKLRPAQTIFVIKETSIYCDFCGESDVEVFTSDYQEHDCEAKNESQICLDCVRQLAKLF